MVKAFTIRIEENSSKEALSDILSEDMALGLQPTTP
jgi:hypothetical protein